MAYSVAVIILEKVVLLLRKICTVENAHWY